MSAQYLVLAAAVEVLLTCTFNLVEQPLELTSGGAKYTNLRVHLRMSLLCWPF